MKVRHVRSFISVVSLACYLSACISWRPAPGAPRDVLSKGVPPSIRVVLTNGQTELLHSARVMNDTLFGHPPYNTIDATRAEIRAIPVDSITIVAVQRINVVRTVLAVAVLGATVIFVAAALSLGDNGVGGL